MKVVRTIELNEPKIRKRQLEEWQQEIADACGVEPVSWNEVFIYIAMCWDSEGEYDRYLVDHSTRVVY
jgi:hypothetical protein